MSKAKEEIKKRMFNIERLSGVNYCQCVSELSDNATDEEWIEAWNNDQSIIMGMINDIELQCGSMELEDFEPLLKEDE